MGHKPVKSRADIYVDPWVSLINPAHNEQIFMEIMARNIPAGAFLSSGPARARGAYLGLTASIEFGRSSNPGSSRLVFLPALLCGGGLR